MYSGPKDPNNAKRHNRLGHAAIAHGTDDMDEINSALSGKAGMHNFMVTNFHDSQSGPVGIAVTDFSASSPSMSAQDQSEQSNSLPPLRQHDNLSDISLAPLSGFDNVDHGHIDTSGFETFDESKFNPRAAAPKTQPRTSAQRVDDFFPAINGGNHASESNYTLSPMNQRHMPDAMAGGASMPSGMGTLIAGGATSMAGAAGSIPSGNAGGATSMMGGMGAGGNDAMQAHNAALSAVPSRFSAPSSQGMANDNTMSSLGSFSALDQTGSSNFGAVPSLASTASRGAMSSDSDNSLLPPSLRQSSAASSSDNDGVFSESDFYESPDHVYESMQQNAFNQNQPRTAFKPTQDQRFANEYSAPASWAVSQNNQGANTNRNPSYGQADQGQNRSFMDERNAFAPVAGRNAPVQVTPLQMQPMQDSGSADNNFDQFADPAFIAAKNATPSFFAAANAKAEPVVKEPPQYLSPGVHSDRDPESRYEHLNQARTINIDKEEVERRSREIWGESKEQAEAKEAQTNDEHTLITGAHSARSMDNGQSVPSTFTNPLAQSQEPSPFVSPGAPLNSALRQAVPNDTSAAPSSVAAEPMPTSIKEDNPIYTAGIEGDKPREMQLLNPGAPSTLINGLAYDFNKNQNEISSGIRNLMKEAPVALSPEAAFDKNSKENLHTAITGSAVASNPYAKAFAALNRTDENNTKISGFSSALNNRQNKDPEVSTMISHGSAAISSGPEVNAKANTNTAITGNRAPAFNQGNQSSTATTVMSMGNKIIDDPYSKFNQAQSRSAELAERGSSFNFSFKGTSSGRPMSPSQAASNRSSSVGAGSSAGDAVAAAFASAGHSNITGNGTAALNKVVSATILGTEAAALTANVADAAAGSAVSAYGAGQNRSSLFNPSDVAGTQVLSGDHTGAAVLSGKNSSALDGKSGSTKESIKALGSATAVDISGFVDPWLTDKTVGDDTASKDKDKVKFFTAADSFKPKPKTEFMELNPLEGLAPSRPDSESIDIDLPELSSDSEDEGLSDIKKLQELSSLDEDDDFLGAFDHTANNKKESPQEGINKINFNPLATPVGKGAEFSLSDEDILKPQNETAPRAKSVDTQKAMLKDNGPKGDLSRSTKLWGLNDGNETVDAFSRLTEAADKLNFVDSEFADFAASQGDLTDSFNSAGEDNNEPLQKHPAFNLNNYLLRCRSAIGQCLYLVQSGLSLDVIDGFNLGYDAYFKTENHAYGSYNPLRPAGSRSYPALIIPLSHESYVAYNIQSLPTKAGPGADEPMHHYIGSSEGFNLQVLDDVEANAIFICSSELDALSLLSLGQQALAIGTPLNAIHVLEHLQQLFSTGKLGLRSHTTFYICMPQQEKQWKDAAEALQAGMSAFNLNAHPLSLHNPYKSIHQALVADRNALQDRLNKLKEISEVTLQEAVHSNAVHGLVLSLQSLAKLELSSMMYTLSSPAAALSRLVMASLIENKNRSILYAGSKMQWQMLCSLLSFAPSSFDHSSSNYRARFLEMPLDLNANIMDAALNHGLQAASFNGMNHPVLMVDAFAYDNDLCSKLSPRLAQLSVEFNIPIMVWCSQEQKSIFEGNSLQTLEMNQGSENEIIFTTLDSTCRSHVFSTISG